MTWEERELAILQAMDQAREEGDDLNAAGLAVVPGLAEGLYAETIEALAQEGYLDAQILRGGGRIQSVFVQRLLPRGLRATGRWPNEEVGADFLALLAQRVQSETDPEAQRGWQRALDSLQALGTGMLSGLLTSVVQRGHF